MAQTPADDPRLGNHARTRYHLSPGCPSDCCPDWHRSRDRSLSWPPSLGFSAETIRAETHHRLHMPKNIQFEPRNFTVYTEKNIEKIPQLDRFSADQVLAMKAVAQVLPFRVNDYVINELIDWNRVPADPMFQLTFPQAGMLQDGELDRMIDLLRKHAGRDRIKAEARRIQLTLNPHPAGQKELNVPRVEGMKVAGMQHKYRETVLFFPSPGQV